MEFMILLFFTMCFVYAYDYLEHGMEQDTMKLYKVLSAIDCYERTK